MPNMIFEGVRILLEVDEKYIQIDDVDDATLRRIWPGLVAEYPGFTVDFCYHNNAAPIAFFKEINAVLEDDCIELHLNNRDLPNIPVSGVVVITESNFDCFAIIHDQKNPDMYWTSAKLRKDLSGWDILAIMDGNAVSGSAFIRSGWEVYALYTESSKNMLTLLNAAVRRGFATLAQKTPAIEREILFNVARDEHMQLEAALKLGFRCTGYYIGYTAKTSGTSPQ